MGLAARFGVGELSRAGRPAYRHRSANLAFLLKLRSQAPELTVTTLMLMHRGHRGIVGSKHTQWLRPMLRSRAPVAKGIECPHDQVSSCCCHASSSPIWTGSVAALYLLFRLVFPERR